jgi:hypothetical protein
MDFPMDFWLFWMCLLILNFIYAGLSKEYEKTTENRFKKTNKEKGHK